VAVYSVPNDILGRGACLAVTSATASSADLCFLAISTIGEADIVDVLIQERRLEGTFFLPWSALSEFVTHFVFAPHEEFGSLLDEVAASRRRTSALVRAPAASPTRRHKASKDPGVANHAPGASRRGVFISRLSFALTFCRAAKQTSADA
jgi:hypothetical protein